MPSPEARRRGLRRARAVALACALACSLLAHATPAAAATPGFPECAPQNLATAVVAEAAAGDSLILRDGSLVRLAGILAPADPARAAEATALLDRLAAGRHVELRHETSRHDRYGSLQAQVRVAADAGAPAPWLQGALLEAGLAQVFTTAQDRVCGAALLAAEADARDRGAGLWQDVRVSRAGDPALVKAVDSYRLVEGRVYSVGLRERTAYLNFGPRWSDDFTVVVSRSLEPDFTAAGRPIDALEGRRVRVRGWLEQWNGPSMRIDHPEQLELLPE